MANVGDRGGRKCTCCTDPRHDAIDAMLLSGVGSYRVAARFGLPQRSVFRHAHTHLAVALQESEAIRMTLSADNLLAKLSALDERTLRLLDTAERTGQLRTALAAIHESRANIDGYARLIALGTLLQANTAQSALSTLPGLSPQSKRDILKILIASGAATAKDDTDDPDEHDEKDEKDETEENDDERERRDSAG